VSWFSNYDDKRIS